MGEIHPTKSHSPDPSAGPAWDESSAHSTHSNQSGMQSTHVPAQVSPEWVLWVLDLAHRGGGEGKKGQMLNTEPIILKYPAGGGGAKFVEKHS